MGLEDEKVVLNEEANLFADMKKKKKKKKPVEENIESNVEESGQSSWLKSDRNYTYHEMLDRVFNILKQNNPELAGEKKKQTIIPPLVYREGTKKTAFANITELCKKMHRPTEHLIQFLYAELGTTGSVDASQRLIIKGKFQQKQIESVVRRYVLEYVSCRTCKSLDTVMTKENRLFFMQCSQCGASRSVSAIKTGFKAQVEKRSISRA